MPLDKVSLLNHSNPYGGTTVEGYLCSSRGVRPAFLKGDEGCASYHLLYSPC